MTAYLPSAALVAAGTLLALSALPLPAYDDPGWRERFEGREVPLESADAWSERWYEAKADAQTARHPRLDAAMGLAALGAGLALLLALHRARSLRDLAALRTPATRRGFYTLATATWLSFVPAQWLWLAYTQHRYDYPPWADVLAIPAAAALLFAIVGLPGVLAGVALALRRAELPAELRVRPALGPPYLVCSGLWVAALLALGVLLSSVTAEPFLAPSALFALYGILSGRAAAVAGAARRRSSARPVSGGTPP